LSGKQPEHFLRVLSWLLDCTPGFGSLLSARAIGDKAMYHTIEFAVEFMVDLEISSQHRLERMLIHRGTRLQAQIKPYVVESIDGPVEVADLFFADGTTTRMLPFQSFTFVD
jgi:hypothetical protein